MTSDHTQLNDLVLKYLLNKGQDIGSNITIDNQKDSGEIGIPTDTFEECLRYFNRRNFIQFFEWKGGGSVIVNMEAYKFDYAGGFDAEDKLLGLEFKKLQVEIESLYSSIAADKLDRISTIMNAILNLYSTFSMGK